MILEQFGLTTALPPVFDHSASGIYFECERMFYYRHVIGRRVIRDERYALVWGKVFHKLAESWRKNQNVNEIVEIIEGNIPPDVDDRYGRTQGRMQEAFLEWLKFNKANPIEVVAQPEQSTTITCNGPCPYYDRPQGCDLTYGGRMDLVVRWNRLIGPLDYKTTVRTDQDPAEEFRPSHQMEGYDWLASHLTGKHCWGVIVEQGIINKSKINFHRFPVPFSKDQIREWAETERLAQAEIRAKNPLDELAWKQNKSRCSLPYKCQFKDVCLAARDQNFRYLWLKAHTVEDRWDFNNPDKQPEEDGGD